MNEIPPGGIFSQAVTEDRVRPIPPTLEQRDVSAIADRVSSSSTAKKVIVTVEPRFENHFVTAPPVEVVEVSLIFKRGQEG